MPGRARRLWDCLGPGILLAATSIGASHLVMAPQAGALFGVTLLWLVPLSHLLKYPAFEFGPRFAAATGESLLAGYARAPGPGRWGLWVFLVSTVAQGIGVLAAVVGIAAAVLASYVGGLGVPGWGGVVVVVVVLLLAGGGFGWLDSLNKVMMAVLALATAVAAFAQPPPEGAAVALVVPRVPDDALALPLIAAILGWMPTGIDVSVWHSLWTLEKRERLEREGLLEADAPPRRRLSLALSDMRCGYLLSIAVALAFLLLGAIHLAGRGAELRGPGFAEALAEAYGRALGGWMFHLFFVAAFFAMFSTAYTVLDGFSRAFAEVMVHLRPRLSPLRRTLYWLFAVATGLVAVDTLATVGNPVRLVLVVAVISLGFAPFLYGLNTFCVSRLIEEKELRPSRPLLVLAWIGVLLMAATAALYVHAHVLPGLRQG